jgi:hypothetical protein
VFGNESVEPPNAIDHLGWAHVDSQSME